MQVRAERPVPDEPLLEASWRTILVSAVKSFLGNNGTMLASALAYNTFFAIPSVLLVVVGLFTLVSGPGTIDSLLTHFNHVMPRQAVSLLKGSLTQLDSHPAQSVVVTVVGFVLAIWSTTGAMTSYMTGINLAYGRKDHRPFLRKRIVALEMAAIIGLAFLLVAVLLMFGPAVERLVASHAGPAAGVVNWIWWIAQWPILLGGLLVAFSALLDLGPDIQFSRRRRVTPGSLVAALLWIAFSGLFAVYTAMFGSYNKTWGALSAVIVMLTWLWLSAVALLLGAEINAQVDKRYRMPAARA
jgi:membrane protein